MRFYGMSAFHWLLVARFVKQLGGWALVELQGRWLPLCGLDSTTAASTPLPSLPPLA